MTRLGFFAAISCAAFSLAVLPISAQTSKTTWDGVYSEAQAATGLALYNAKCSMCHGQGAGGGDAPSLTDSGFAANWDTLSVQDLFDRTRISMPQDAPGSMSREETAAVIAYLLKQNRFPAGSEALSDRADQLSQVTYVATKP